MVGNSYPESLISLFFNLLLFNYFFSFLFFSFLLVLPAIKEGRVGLCVRGGLMSSFRMVATWKPSETLRTFPKYVGISPQAQGVWLANMSRNWRKYKRRGKALQALETLKQMALVGLRLCNSQLQLNALLPSGSVYFLNINSRDRFKACLEIKHIIMWAKLTRTIYCTLHSFWANRKRRGY